MSKSLTDSYEVRMGITNDQENIKRLRKEGDGSLRSEEWKQIRKDMEAGSGATGGNVSTVFSGDKSSMASILHILEKELQNQGDAVAEFETQDWQDEGEWIAPGWCEALEFAIKTIKRHNKSCEADQ